VTAILTLAVLVPLIAGAYDLSVGANVNLTAILAVYLQTADHWSMVPAIIAAILCGTAIGVINGFLVVKLGVNSFIATLGMGSVIAAFQTIVTSNNQPIPPSSATWGNITQTTVFGFEIVVVYMLVIALVLWWALEHTPPGRYLYAIGGNAEAARLSGVGVGKWVWLSLITSGALAGVAGVLFASLVGPSLTFGPGLLLPAFAAAFLGSTQLKPGRFNVWGSIIAIYVLAVGVQGLSYVTNVQWLSDMFYGVGLIVAVSFAVWRQRASAEKRRPIIAEEGLKGDLVQESKEPDDTTSIVGR
jgi:ribose transport system permease protein